MNTWEDRKAFYNKDYFVGYGHYVSKDGHVSYDPEYLKQGAEILYKLTSCKSILDCGCAVGFLLRGFQLFDPNIKLGGAEISNFAVSNAIPEVRDFIKVCDISDSIPFDDDSFELVTCFDVFEHQQDYPRLVKSIKEVCRVSNKHIFLRQPMIFTRNCDEIGDVHNLWRSLNPLPHKARLELVDVHPQIYSATPDFTSMEHPMCHPIKFWVSLFEFYGFRQIMLPENVLIFDNPLHIFSLNVLMFEKEEHAKG